MDKVFSRIRGPQHYLWRAVNQNGVVRERSFHSRRAARKPQKALLCHHVGHRVAFVCGCAQVRVGGLPSFHRPR